MFPLRYLLGNYFDKRFVSFFFQKPFGKYFKYFLSRLEVDRTFFQLLNIFLVISFDMRLVISFDIPSVNILKLDILDILCYYFEIIYFINSGMEIKSQNHP